MADIAFQGDAAIKAQALERLDRHVAAGSFVFYPAWADGVANILGAVVESDDKQAYADRLGYPIAWVTALESIVNALRSLPLAQAYARSLLERTPVGADLSHLVSQLLALLLNQPEIAALTASREDVEAARWAVLDLHGQAIAGQTADRKAWKAVRLAAVAASDAAAKDRTVQLASQIVEAAAWPPSMRSVLLDSLSAYGRYESFARMDEIGWTDANESRVFRIRQQAEADGRMAELIGLARVLALLDIDDPALAAGFRQRLEQVERLGEMYRLIGHEAVELIARAPVRSAASVRAA